MFLQVECVIYKEKRKEHFNTSFETLMKTFISRLVHFNFNSYSKWTISPSGAVDSFIRVQYNNTMQYSIQFNFITRIILPFLRVSAGF